MTDGCDRPQRAAASALADARVAIVGMGLMGGSLAGALRGKCRAVVGVARRTESIDLARARGLIDQGTTDLASSVCADGRHPPADVVVLATPVRVILRLLDELGPLLPEDCLLMDLGSTKAHIVARMAKLPAHVQPLGGHPMCGKEVSGVAAADPALYEGRTFVLTPLSRTSLAALELGHALVGAVGAHALVLDPRRHDRLVAAISHLPYLLACGLVGAAERAATADPMVWEVAASGFRDTSRLAASDVTMMLDILLTNREAVLQVMEACGAQLRDLSQRLEAGDEDGLRHALAVACDRRGGMFK